MTAATRNAAPVASSATPGTIHAATATDAAATTHATSVRTRPSRGVVGSHCTGAPYAAASAELEGTGREAEHEQAGDEESGTTSPTREARISSPVWPTMLTSRSPCTSQAPAIDAATAPTTAHPNAIHAVSAEPMPNAQRTATVSPPSTARAWRPSSGCARAPRPSGSATDAMMTQRTSENQSIAIDRMTSVARRLHPIRMTVAGSPAKGDCPGGAGQVESARWSGSGRSLVRAEARDRLVTFGIVVAGLAACVIAAALTASGPGPTYVVAPGHRARPDRRHADRGRALRAALHRHGAVRHPARRRRLRLVHGDALGVARRVDLQRRPRVGLGGRGRDRVR